MYAALSYQDEHDDDDRVVREVMMGMVGPHYDDIITHDDDDIDNDADGLLGR